MVAEEAEKEKKRRRVIRARLESQREGRIRWEDIWMNTKFQLVLQDTRQKRDFKKVERLHVSLKNVALKTHKKRWGQ